MNPGFSTTAMDIVRASYGAIAILPLVAVAVARRGAAFSAAR
jgi:hypothetical protein